MKHQNVFTLICLALLLSFSTALLAKKDVELPEVTEDGLVRVPDSRMAVVYVDPEASLEPYAKVMLLEAYVAFKKNWRRDQNSSSVSRIGVTSNDMERIKTQMAKEFNEVFSETLEKGGYPVVEQAGEDVLLIRPAIVDLNPTAPDTMKSGMSRTYTQSAGDMSLYIELYDSQTGDIIAKALDKRVDGRHDGYYSWANPASNRHAAKKILSGWAEILLDALNEAHGRSPGE